MSRYPVLKDVKLVTFNALASDITLAEELQREREASALSYVLRDALHVGLVARLPLARAIYTLAALDVDEGDALHAGPEHPEDAARHRLIRDLMNLYGYLALGRAPAPSTSRDELVTGEKEALQLVGAQATAAGRLAVEQRLQQIDQQSMAAERAEARRRLEEIEQRAREAERHALITDLVRLDLGLPLPDRARAIDRLHRLFFEDEPT